jgi:superfamily II DNA helicase RecQ
MTRAKEHLELTWAGKPSRFLEEIGVVSRPEPRAPDGTVVKALKAWRLERARGDGVPAFVVFHDKTLDEIARRLPRDRIQLAAVPGIGPAKLDRYGDELLATLAGAAPDGL